MIIISDQQADCFLLYPRKDSSETHIITIWRVPGISVLPERMDATYLPESFNSDFPKGIFIAMSEGRVFHYYDIREMEGVNNQQ